MKHFPIVRGAALAPAALAACDDGPTNAAPEKQSGDLARQVEAMGFRGDMVQDFGDYVLVEGDVYIPKAQLRAGPPTSSDDPLRPRFQYRTTNLVGSAKVNGITVDLSGLASQTGWQTAAREALGHWSGISGSYVRLVESGPADITVGTTCISSNVAAYASFPSGGNPGNVVYVNTCFGYATSHAQKVHNMVHEFGHTLGFRHSNYTQQGETAGVEGAVHISGTPTSGNATGSVMNGGTALNSWAGFAASDLTAVRALYPLPGPGGFSITDQGGVPLLSWNAVPGATSYQVTLIMYEYEVDQYGQEWYQGRYFQTVGSTTGTSLLDGYQIYTGYASCDYPDPFDPAPEPKLRRYWYEYAVQAVHPNGSSHIDAVRRYAPIAQLNCGLW